MNHARLKIFIAVLSITVTPGGLMVIAQKDGQGTGRNSRGEGKTSHSQTIDNRENEGQRVFAENCSRCHNAPESFSPRIAGTISRHMRVRANLSAEEERALIRFLNP